MATRKQAPEGAEPKKRKPGRSIPEAMRHTEALTVRTSTGTKAILGELAEYTGRGKGALVREALEAAEELVGLAKRHDVPLASVAEVAVQVAGLGLEPALRAVRAGDWAEYARVTLRTPPRDVVARARERAEAVSTARATKSKKSTDPT